MKMPWHSKKQVSAARRSRQKQVSWQLSPLTKQLIIGGAVLLLVGAVVAAVGYVTRLPSLQIAQISVAGGVTIDHARVEETIRQQLGGTYIALVPRAFTWFYPEEQIAAAIRSIPRVNEVELHRPDRNSLSVSFTEYIPFGLWCNSNDRCLFIDATGYAFAEAPKLTGNTLFRVRHDEREPTLGEHIWDADSLRAAMEFAESLEHEFEYFVSEVRIVGEYDIEFQLAGGGVIKVSQRQSLTDTLSNLKFVLSADEFVTLSSDEFQYIDLRFGDRVFVNDSEIATTTQLVSDEPETASATTSVPEFISPTATTTE